MKLTGLKIFLFITALMVALPQIATAQNTRRPGLEVLPLDNTIVNLQNVQTQTDPEIPGRIIDIQATTNTAPRVAMNFYRSRLVSAGWKLGTPATANTSMLSKDGSSITININTDTSRGMTVVHFMLDAPVPQIR